MEVVAKDVDGDSSTKCLFISKIDDGYIDGYIGDFSGNVCKADFNTKFHGTVKNRKADCQYYNEETNRSGRLAITFGENNIEVEFNDGGAEGYQSYHIADIRYWGEPIIIETKLDSWGDVRLFLADKEPSFSSPWAFLLNKQGDILYEFDTSDYKYSMVQEAVIEDLDGDGLKDVELVMYDGDKQIHGYFFQQKNGFFVQKEQIQLGSTTKRFIDTGSKEKQFTMESNENGDDRITLYDKSGNVVFSMEYPYSKSWINENTENILEIVVSVGFIGRTVP